MSKRREVLIGLIGAVPALTFLGGAAQELKTGCSPCTDGAECRSGVCTEAGRCAPQGDPCADRNRRTEHRCGAGGRNKCCVPGTTDCVRANR
jgi:hypothetical protein